MDHGRGAKMTGLKKQMKLANGPPQKPDPEPMICTPLEI